MPEVPKRCFEGNVRETQMQQKDHTEVHTGSEAVRAQKMFHRNVTIEESTQ